MRNLSKALLMLDSAAGDNLRLKITLSRKSLSTLKRKTYFGEHWDLDLERCASTTKNADVLKLLACHPVESVRKNVAQNQCSPYETLLYLLKDAKVDVIRQVLAFGKLKQDDFLSLAEKFFDKSKRDLFAKLDDTKYLRLIKLTGNLASWPKSQSICLIHNKHIGIDAIKNIDINSFEPFRDGGLEMLLQLKNTKIIEVKNNIPFEERQLPPEKTLPWNLHFSHEHRRLDRGKDEETAKSVSAERFLIEQIDKYNHYSNSKKLDKKTAPNSHEFDKKLAKNDNITQEQFNRLLDSNDKRIVKLAIKNPRVKVSDLERFFGEFPDLVFANTEFQKKLKRKPSLIKKLDVKDRIRLLKKNADCPSIIASSVIKDYIDFVTGPTESISKSLSSWAKRLQLIASHGSTTGKSLQDLHNLVYTNNEEISEKRVNLIRAIENNPNFNKD